MTEWIVTSSALILIVIALRGLLKGKISLRLQYGLWALVLVRLLIPFSIADSAISIANILSVPTITEADNALADYKDSIDTIRNDYIQRGETVTNEELREQALQALRDKAQTKLEQEYEQSGTQIQTPEIREEIRQEVQQQVAAISFTAMVTDALPYLWLAGVVLVGAVLIGSNLHFGWKLRRSREELDLPHVPAKVYLTDYVATPCLFGIGKPDIYLTNEVMEDSRMRSHVLAHEMSHYRQGDHIWSVLRCVCLVLHWYNPLVWVAAILSKQDAELACDEATIRNLGEEERVAYGRTLIGMTCVRRDPRSLMLTATTMLGTKKTLKERVLLIAKKPRMALYTLVACLLVAAIAVGCTFTGASSNPSNPIIEPNQDSVTNPTINPSTDSTVDSTEPTDEDLGPGPGSPPEIVDTITYPDFPSVGAERRALTEDELAAFSAMFQWRANGYNWYNYALKSEYSTPVDLNLLEFFYSAPVENLTQEDLEFYGDAASQIHKYSVSVMNEVLSTYFNIAFHETNSVGLDQMVHNKDASCYYHEHGDVKASHHTIYEGYVNPNGTVVLYYIDQIASVHGDVIKEVTLKHVDQGSHAPNWHVLSNVRIYTKIESNPDIEKFQELLNGYWYWRAMGCVFEKPEELSLRYLVFNGFTDDEDRPDISTYTDNEVAFMKKLALDTWQDESVWVNTRKISRNDITDVLANYFGLNLDDVTIPDDWVYFEETDSYYCIRFDGYRLSGYTITEVQTGADGMVYVYWTSDRPVLDTRYELFDKPVKYLENPQMVMVLKEKADGSYLVLMNLPVDELIAQSEEEYFQNLLTSENGYWYWRAMGCVFETPEELNLNLLCYIGMENNQLSSTFTDDEIAFLKSNPMGLPGDETAWSNASKLPRQELDSILQNYFGITLEDVTIPDGWVYNSETDAYYHVKYDAYGVVGQTVTDVQIDDNGLIYLYWTTDHYIWDTRYEDDVFLENPQMVMVLQEKADGGYLVLMNMPVEAEEPANPVPHITRIQDRTKEENLSVAEALELFFMDAECSYYFPGVKSQYIIVHYSDGTTENIITALQTERATIADLDTFGIKYIVNPRD